MHAVNTFSNVFQFMMDLKQARLGWGKGQIWPVGCKIPLSGVEAPTYTRSFLILHIHLSRKVGLLLEYFYLKGSTGTVPPDFDVLVPSVSFFCVNETQKLSTTCDVFPLKSSGFVSDFVLPKRTMCFGHRRGIKARYKLRPFRWSYLVLPLQTPFWELILHNNTSNDFWMTC